MLPSQNKSPWEAVALLQGLLRSLFPASLFPAPVFLTRPSSP